MDEETGRRSGVKFMVCKNGKKEVQPSKDNVTFNCHTFNVCNLTLKELAQNLLNEGFVKQMEYRPKLTTDLEGKQVVLQQYCGRGVEGDTLCVKADKNLFGATLLNIVLERGRLGQGSVSFD
jgi:hypothetical protein